MSEDKTMLISIEKFEALCRNSVRLDMICDYIMERAETGNNYIGLEVIACMAGIQEEVEAATAKEAAEHDE